MTKANRSTFCLSNHQGDQIGLIFAYWAIDKNWIDPYNFVRPGAVDIASASGTRRPEFESREGIRFLGNHSSAVVYQNDPICVVCVLKRRNNKGTGRKNILLKYTLWANFYKLIWSPCSSTSALADKGRIRRITGLPKNFSNWS
jgi:hypothetical protein